jgi:hypothetical protein
LITLDSASARGVQAMVIGLKDNNVDRDQFNIELDQSSRIMRTVI